MELKELIKLIKKDWNHILVFSLGFMASGIFLYYFLPREYKATGSFLILRSVSRPTTTEFSYEGYYASQTSSNYTQSYSALLQSYDIRGKSLSDLGIQVTEETLRESGRNIKVKKQSAQMVSLTISSTSKDFALNFWNALSNNSIEASKKLNDLSGDPNISILRAGDFPIVYESFRSVYLNAFLGFFLGTTLGIVVTALKRYLS